MVPWLEWAFRELGHGVNEVSGVNANPRILEYHLRTSLKASSDEVPWCSSFICTAFEEAAIPSTRSAAAKSWLDWGIMLERPREGCVVLLKRGTNLTVGHVGFYVGETPTHVRILGGNQSNSISVITDSKINVLAYRWPSKEHWTNIHNQDAEDDICKN